LFLLRGTLRGKTSLDEGWMLGSSLHLLLQLAVAPDGALSLWTSCAAKTAWSLK
jgi:hypothetical protein